MELHCFEMWCCLNDSFVTYQTQLIITLRHVFIIYREKKKLLKMITNCVLVGVKLNIVSSNNTKFTYSSSKRISIIMFSYLINQFSTFSSPSQLFHFSRIFFSSFFSSGFSSWLFCTLCNIGFHFNSAFILAFLSQRNETVSLYSSSFLHIKFFQFFPRSFVPHL